jgi:hypothetical protein
VLQKLFNKAKFLSLVLREYLEMNDYYELYYKCAERLRFERMTFDQFGRTAADFARYRRHTAPILEQANTIENQAIDALQSELMSMEQLALGIRYPLREPICYSLILPSTWAVLKFAFADDDATADGFKYTRVRVAPTTGLSPDDRKALQNLVLLEEARQTKRASQAAAASFVDVTEAIKDLKASINNQSVSVTVQAAPVDVRLVDVHPDLMKRAVGDTTEMDPKGMADAQGPNSRNPEAVGRSKRGPGRPTMKLQIFRIQLKRWATGVTAGSLAKEARQIQSVLKEQLKGLPQGDISIPAELSMQNIIRYRYRRLQNIGNTINYLRGVGRN